MSEAGFPISVERVPYETQGCTLFCLGISKRFDTLGNPKRAEMWTRAGLWSKLIVCVSHRLVRSYVSLNSSWCVERRRDWTAPIAGVQSRWRIGVGHCR